MNIVSENSKKKPDKKYLARGAFLLMRAFSCYCPFTYFFRVNMKNNENDKGRFLPVFSVVWNKTDTFSFKVSVQFVDPSLTVVFVCPSVNT